MSSMMTHPRDQMSEAVDAPSIWMTSGATGERTRKDGQRTSAWKVRFWRAKEELTPVGCARDVVLFLLLDRDETERHAKVGKLDVSDLGREDVGGLEVTVDDLTEQNQTVSVSEPPGQTDGKGCGPSASGGSRDPRGS
jgi:hypothetical protein